MVRISAFLTLSIAVCATVPCQGMSWFYKPAPKAQEAIDPVKVVLQPYVATLQGYIKRFPKTSAVIGTAFIAAATYKLYSAVSTHIQMVTYPTEKFLEVLAKEKAFIDALRSQGTKDTIEPGDQVSAVPALTIPAGMVIDTKLITQYAHAYRQCVIRGNSEDFYYFTLYHTFLTEKITGN